MNSVPKNPSVVVAALTYKRDGDDTTQMREWGKGEGEGGGAAVGARTGADQHAGQGIPIGNTLQKARKRGQDREGAGGQRTARSLTPSTN